jgi:hypothetical protein
MKHLYPILLIAVACTTVSAADVYKHEESGLQFQLPKGWTCTEKDNKLFIANKDKIISCVCGVIPQESAKAIFADINKFVDSLDGLDDVEVTDGPEKETVNGLEQTWYEGTASYDDENGTTHEIEWDMTVISGGKAILFLVGTGALDDNEDEYEAFFESIQKIKSDTDATE